MFEHQKINKLDDFFIGLSNRKSNGIYFYRINAYTDEIGEFLKKYYNAARTAGVIIEGKIPNPDEKNLAYYSDIMGMNFKMDLGFIMNSLKKWLPRMNDLQRKNVGDSIYNTLTDLRRAGKNDNMLKNAYIKFMCWLYYKFERILNLLGTEKVPKILYEGTIGSYELMLITILSNAGCDVVLLQYNGDSGYLKLDGTSRLSFELKLPGMRPFPDGFSLKAVREQIEKDFNRERLYGAKPSLINCTNAWISGNVIEDIESSFVERGTDDNLFYNCFIRVNGAEDKLTYINDLYEMYQKLIDNKRRLVVISERITPPGNDEIALVRRRNYTNQEQMLSDLVCNISFSSNKELQRLMVKSFLDVMLEAGREKDCNIHKLLNKAVYLICWLKRYENDLFSEWKMPQISCFILMGDCRSEYEQLFLKMLARLPVDVLILSPNLNVQHDLKDRLLYEKNYTESVNVSSFPKTNSNIRIGTAAYQAERELDKIMYTDSGMYRNQQYTKANVINLQTMYEEIKLLWDEELKYRPNFSTVDGKVNIPVIFSKVSGVKNGNLTDYWLGIKELITEDSIVIKSTPYIKCTAMNPIKPYVTEFYKNNKFYRNKIKQHPQYQYGVLREEMQEHILDKLELLIERKIIKGTFENGTEYTILSVVLNLPKEIVRMIQKFDFTKKNPKMIYINTGEKAISLEDSILTAFLNLIGFDIIFYIPTGYQSVEKYFNYKIMEEHQIGDYLYDLQVPDFNAVQSTTRHKFWRDKIFKRGT